MKKLKKGNPIIYTILLCTFFCLSISVKAEPRKNGVRAVLYLCNPIKNSYCHETQAYGEGFGLIVFDKRNKKSYFPVRAGGKDIIASAQMTGVLQAFETLQWRAHRHEELFFSDEILVSGYFGVEPILKSDIVFYITEFNDDLDLAGAIR